METEIVSSSQRPDVEEILHSAVADPQHHHRMELLSNDSLGRVATHDRRIEREKNRKREACRCRIDKVAESDVNLQHHTSAVEAGGHADPDAFVFSILPDFLAPDGFKIEDDTIVNRLRADLPNALSDLADYWTAVTEKIDILRRPVQLPVPSDEYHRTFENELVAMR